MAPATDTRAALIVGHGSPSAPEQPDAAVAALAARVAKRMPGWTVAGATLAAPGALERALEAVPDRGLMVYPLFMADGWFVRLKLPQRLRQAGRTVFEVLAPLGLDPATPVLGLKQLREALVEAGMCEEDTTVVLAAHGSPSDPRPREIAEQAGRTIAAAGRFRAVRAGYLEEDPRLEDVAEQDGPTLCLPFFAGRAGHVERDIPDALARANYAGRLLEPVGVRPEVAAIVAAALANRAGRRAA